MRTALTLALVSLIVLPACTPSPTDQIVGKWDLDTSAMKEQMKKEMKEDDPMAAMALGMLDAMKGTAEFKADGTATMTLTMGPMGENTMNGKYKIEGAGADLKITMTDEEGKDTTTPLTFDSADRFSITDKQGDKEMTMVFTRAKS